MVALSLRTTMREIEEKSIRQFVRGQLRAEQDLSSLTLGILKRRYLATVEGDELSASAKSLLKQVVEQELIKMQENKSGGESEAEDVQNRRKRERENETKSESENEVTSKQKKSRCYVNFKSESEDEESNTVGSAASADEEQSKTGSEGEKQEIRKSPEKKNAKFEEDTEDGETRIKTREQSDDEGESNANKTNSSQSSDESEKEDNVAEKNTNQADSDSSSLLSLEDEQEPKSKGKKVNKKKEKDQDGGKKKSTKKDKDGVTKKKEDEKAVVRLKRYISLCGERRSYKKLLSGCRSVRSMVAVLKSELEDIGVHGRPSIEKCKKVRLKKEKARELAELDISNIIESQGRSKRRGAFAGQQQHDSPCSIYKHALTSGSDSEEENNMQKGRRRTSDWANLKGIISDDADSN
ncbi:HIRA-interacting protein 3 isoform X1 [Festucalex cinctus]